MSLLPVAGIPAPYSRSEKSMKSLSAFSRSVYSVINTLGCDLDFLWSVFLEG